MPCSDDMQQRLEEAEALVARFSGHPYEAAARAFLRATIEQANKQLRATTTTK